MNHVMTRMGGQLFVKRLSLNNAFHNKPFIGVHGPSCLSSHGGSKHSGRKKNRNLWGQRSRCLHQTFYPKPSFCDGNKCIRLELPSLWLPCSVECANVPVMHKKTFFFFFAFSPMVREPFQIFLFIFLSTFTFLLCFNICWRKSQFCASHFLSDS